MTEKATRSICVDGTNIVRGSFGYGGPSFRQQEEADAERLITALSQVCVAVGDRVEIEVIFDGNFRPMTSKAPNLRIRFARETGADDMIIDRVRNRRYANSGIVVVTGDSELGRRATDEGARWQRVSPGTALETMIQFIERLFP